MHIDRKARRLNGDGGDFSYRNRGEIVDHFSRAVRIADDCQTLHMALGDAARALGFDYFMLQGEGARLWLADPPGGWRFQQDPQRDLIWRAASRSLTPFLWSDVMRLLALSPEEARLFADAPAGFAAPIHAPVLAAQSDGVCGCASFLVRKGARLPAENFAAAHYVGLLAFDAAQRLGRGQARSTPHLTPRQRDCMVLAAQGKSDWEIGTLLGIGESTVHKHIEDAKRRFGVSTRIQLVVRSLADATLSFSDVFSGTAHTR